MVPKEILPYSTSRNIGDYEHPISKTDCDVSLQDINYIKSLPHTFEKFFQQLAPAVIAAQEFIDPASVTMKDFLLLYATCQCKGPEEGISSTFIAGHCPINSNSYNANYLWYLFLARINARGTLDLKFGEYLTESIKQLKKQSLLTFTAPIPLANKGIILLLPCAANTAIRNLTTHPLLRLTSGFPAIGVRNVLQVSFFRIDSGSPYIQSKRVRQIHTELYFRTNGTLVCGTDSCILEQEKT
jgi:hypothetical protein